MAQQTILKKKPAQNNKSIAPVREPDFTIIYDTTYKGWEYVATGKIVNNSLSADTKGNMYCILERKESKLLVSRRINKLVDKIWVDIQDSIEYPVSQIAFTKDGAPLIKTLVSNYWLSNEGWKETNEKIIAEKYDPNKPEARVTVNNRSYSSRILKGPGGNYVDCLAIFNDSMIITPRKIFSIQPIPFMSSYSEDKKSIAYRKSTGIFEVKGKKGIRNTAGDTLVYPVFESITIGAYATLHFLGKNMDFSTRNPSNPNLLEGPVESEDTCSRCKGSGKLGEDKFEKIKEEVKVWVSEETIMVPGVITTQTQQGKTVTYQTMTKKVIKPGYWKVSYTYKDKIAAGAKCTTCDGGKKRFITRKQFYFDKTTNSYVAKVIRETR